MVSGSFSLLCSRFFSPFLHSTGALSVSREYLALRDGPREFVPDFSCPALLRIPTRCLCISPTGLSPSMIVFSNTVRLCFRIFCVGPSTPTPPKRHRFGLFRVRSPLLAESFLFSSPAATKMFQFAAFASGFKPDAGPSARRVVPFGNPRINGHLHLNAAYRSLSRPSSPPGA